MRVPLSWLKNYVRFNLPANELAHRLTMAGNEVGDVEIVGADLDPERLVIGHILSVDPHPNADRLKLPTVDIGNGETATVVCGAPNVAAGQKIAFAKEGAMLFSPRSGKMDALKAATIRGVRSAGMVCSPLELGLSDDHEGILVLDDDAPIGVPLVEYIGDAVLDVEVTPNRPDCLSILGIAREVAALTDSTVTEPDLSYPESDTPIESQAKVEISDPDLCFRYTATLIHDIEIAESPQWMQDALTKAGLRPINNIVDITNYVMLEYGQPLHAFDFGKVHDNTIVVRAARHNENMVTLDGATRTLHPPMLCIADTEDAIGLAGVMGGANTEIDETTTAVLLESANFHAINTRRTRLALRMDSEASYRFERGIRPEVAPRALRRATQLMLQIAGGTASKGILDIYPDAAPMPSVQISRHRIRQALGVDYTMQRVERTLESLGFQRDRAPESIMPTMDAFSVGGAPEADSVIWMKPPYWRSDITIEDDIVEELARIIGYDSIPTTMLSTPIPHGQPQASRILRERIKDILTATGMRETISYSLVSANMLERVGVDTGETDVMRIANPMSSEFTLLRTSLRASVLSTLANNRRISQTEGIRIYEIGSVYLPKEEARERDLPDEREMLVGVLCGKRYPISWNAPSDDMGFYDGKGTLEALFAQLRAYPRYEAYGDDAILRRGRTAQILCGDVPVGVIGEVRQATLDRFDIEGSPVAMFEVDLASLRGALPDETLQHIPAIPYPESYRDLALVVDAEITSARIQRIIERHRMVARSMPFDIYEGEGVPEGKRSIAFRIVFQSPRGTLTSDQVDGYQSNILQQLQRELGVELRD